MVRIRVTVAIAWAVLMVLALGFHVAQGSPESVASGDSWSCGPTADTLARAALARIESGLKALSDPEAGGTERLELYRGAMADADGLLARSLFANPVQPTVWARLAAIRWEASPGADGGNGTVVELIRNASSMASDIPEVQSQLGGLLLRMGRSAEAGPYFRRAVTLDPRVASGSVAALAEVLADPEAVAGILPEIPEVLVALRRPYLDAGAADRYLTRVERALPSGDVAVLRTYADASIEAKTFARARAALEALPPFGAADVEATRLVQLSRLAGADNNPGDAVTLARRAAVLAPQDPVVLQAEGLALLAAGDSNAAVAGLSRAIAAAARARASTQFRASLYADLGRAEEAAGHPDRAYDDYRRALDLNPEAAFARWRLDVMRRSAGAR